MPSLSVDSVRNMRKPVLVAITLAVAISAGVVGLVMYRVGDDCTKVLKVPSKVGAAVVSPEFSLVSDELRSADKGQGPTGRLCFDKGQLLQVAGDEKGDGASANVTEGATSRAFVSLAAATTSPNYCHYWLSEPFRVRLAAGNSVVSATITPLYCFGTAFPTSSRVCVSPTGGAGNCNSGFGWNRAQAFVGPWQSGSFSSTGNGCAAAANPPSSMCKPGGPKVANPPI